MTIRARALEGGNESATVPETNGEPRGNIWRRDGGQYEAIGMGGCDHVSCPDTRRSVSGGAVMFGRGAISWALRAQRIRATATSKSEYVALAEIVNELRFLRQVETFMVPPIDYNIHVHEDNEGAIKMAENRFSSPRTRCEFTCKTVTHADI